MKYTDTKKKYGNNQFEVNVILSNEKSYAKLIDLENKTEYILVDLEASNGKFVGELKQEYEKIIEDIIIKCTSKEVLDRKSVV